MEARKEQLRSEIEVRRAMVKGEQHKREELEQHISKW